MSIVKVDSGIAQVDASAFADEEPKSVALAEKRQGNSRDLADPVVTASVEAFLGQGSARAAVVAALAFRDKIDDTRIITLEDRMRFVAFLRMLQLLQLPERPDRARLSLELTLNNVLGEPWARHLYRMANTDDNWTRPAPPPLKEMEFRRELLPAGAAVEIFYQLEPQMVRPRLVVDECSRGVAVVNLQSFTTGLEDRGEQVYDEWEPRPPQAYADLSRTFEARRGVGFKIINYSDVLAYFQVRVVGF